MKKMLCAVTVMLLGGSFVAAEEFTASISKIEDGKITFRKFGGGGRTKGKTKGKRGGRGGESTTMTLSKNVKVYKAKFNREAKKIERGEVLADGLKNEAFKNLGKRGGDAKGKGGRRGRGQGGVFARIVTEGDQVIEIQVLNIGGRRGKGGNKKIDT